MVGHDLAQNLIDGYDPTLGEPSEALRPDFFSNRVHG